MQSGTLGMNAEIQLMFCSTPWTSACSYFYLEEGAPLFWTKAQNQLAGAKVISCPREGFNTWEYLKTYRYLVEFLKTPIWRVSTNKRNQQTAAAPLEE